MAQPKEPEKKDTHTIASVAYVPAKDLPEELRRAKGIGAFDFAEIKVFNSEPMTKVDKVSSPAKKVKQVLAEHEIKINLD